MERYNRDQYNDSNYSQDRYGNNRPARDRHGEFEQHGYRNFQGSQDRPYNNSWSKSGQERYQGNSNSMTHQEQGRHQDSRNRDYDNEMRYYDNLREDNKRPGNVAQGYGITSFDGTSDRYNTLNSRHREDDAHLDQTYYSGRRDGFEGPGFGGGMGEAETHSDRGIPNYGTRSFTDDRGFGMGSSYGATNYGGGTGYSNGNGGGSWGNTSYGNSSGNMGGIGSMGTSAGGGGNSSFGSPSQNSDRGNMGD